MTQLDEVDKKILEILALDSRIPVRELARRLGASPATVSRRLRRLEEEKVIKAYVSVIEDEAIGKGSRAVLMVRTGGESDQHLIAEELTNMPDICNVFLTMGNYDMICTVCTQNESKIYEMIQRLRKLKGVLWVDFASIVERKKVMSAVLE